MNKSTHYNQQKGPEQFKPDFEEICICQNPESGHHSIYLKVNSGFHTRKNPNQQYLKVVTSSSVMLHSAKTALIYNHAA